MNSDPFQLRIPNTIMGNGAVENVGELAKELGGKKALIVTDTGIAEAGLVDHVKQSLEKKGIESGTFDGCKPDALIGVIKECAQFTAKGGYDLLIGVGGGSVMDTGMDALAHALEGYTNVRANVVSDMFAEKAITLVSDNLRGAHFKGNLNGDEDIKPKNI